jgi:DNA-binding transcriptional regulator YhcF (GntR family)
MLLNKALKAAQGLRQIGYAILQAKEGGMVSEERGRGVRIIFVQDRNSEKTNYVTREQLEEAIQRATEQGAQGGAKIARRLP